MTDADAPASPGFAELDALTTDELRERAFSRAEKHLDVKFFWDLVRHLPASEDFAAEDASGGGVGESIGDVIAGVRELLGSHDEEIEPLLRARYIDYLQTGD